jgi:biotin operon repressor
MPISPCLDATAAWQAAALAAQLGGSQANISAHLTRLKQSGVITSWAHGHATPPTPKMRNTSVSRAA